MILIYAVICFGGGIFNSCHLCIGKILLSARAQFLLSSLYRHCKKPPDHTLFHQKNEQLKGLEIFYFR